MKLTIDVNRRFLAMTGVSILAGGVLFAVACFLISAHQQRKAEEMQAQRASDWACEKKKEQYLSDHRFDSLIKEQQWIMSHAKDPRLKSAPHGKQLEQFLNGVYSDVTSSELKAFTGRDKDHSLSELDSGPKPTGKPTSGPSTFEQMLAEGSLPDMPSKPSDAGRMPASGLEAYYLVPENKGLMKALVNVAGGEADAKEIAKPRGYTYSFKQEDARRNVLRAIRFANIFSPYSETLSMYAHTGGDLSQLDRQELEIRNPILAQQLSEECAAK